MDSITEPVEKVSSQSIPPKGRAHRGNSKDRRDRRGRSDPVRKNVGELVKENDGMKEQLSKVSKELSQLEKDNKEALAKVALIEAMSSNALNMEGLRMDLWIGDPVRSLNWELILMFLTFISWVVLARFSLIKEATIGVCGILFVLFRTSLYVKEDCLGHRQFKMRAPGWWGWLSKRTPGSRHLRFVKLLNERHEDLRHDCNSLSKLKHADAVYAVVSVEDLDEDLTDEWTVSLELLSQLLAPKYMNPQDANDVQFERIMRDASRFHSVNISRYYRWTEHIYIATAHVAYAHAVHLKERTLGDFVLAPRPLDV